MFFLFVNTWSRNGFAVCGDCKAEVIFTRTFHLREKALASTTTGVCVCIAILRKRLKIFRIGLRYNILAFKAGYSATRVGKVSLVEIDFTGKICWSVFPDMHVCVYLYPLGNFVRESRFNFWDHTYK